MVIEKKDKSNKWTFITAGIIFIIFIAIMFIYKYNTPTFPNKTFWILVAGGSILIIGLAVGYWYWQNRESALGKRLKDELSKLPEPISIEECREIRDREILEQFENYMQTPEYEDTPSVGVGLKSSVYICLAQGKYDDPYASEKYPNFFVAINMHYPEKKRAIIKNPSQQQVDKIISRIASFPEGEPDITEINEYNPLLGTQRNIKEVKHNKTNEKKVESKEDLHNEDKQQEEKK